MLAAQDKKPPEKLVFQYKGGEAVFTHAAHIDREKGECATCHPKLWPQSARNRSNQRRLQDLPQRRRRRV